jgi:hypothetical protein
MALLKMYIQNIEINSISHKWEPLHKYLVKENEFTQLHSKSGIYIIQNNQCFLLQNENGNENENENEKYDTKKYSYHNREYELLLDYSEEHLQKIPSQLPTQYTLNKIIKMEYKLSTKSPLTLVINGSYGKITNTNNIFLKQEKKIIQQETHFIPINFYFECLEKDMDLDNPFFIDEFNVFLSLLN